MGNIDLVNGETDGTGVDDLLGLGLSPWASEYVGRLELEETENDLLVGKVVGRGNGNTSLL